MLVEVCDLGLKWELTRRLERPPAPSHLLVTECDHRIDPCRPSGRQIASCQGNGGERHRSCDHHNRIAGMYFVEQSTEQPSSDKSSDQSRGKAKSGKAHSVFEYE